MPRISGYETSANTEAVRRYRARKRFMELHGFDKADMARLDLGMEPLNKSRIGAAITPLPGRRGRYVPVVMRVVEGRYDPRVTEQNHPRLTPLVDDPHYGKGAVARLDHLSSDRVFNRKLAEWCVAHHFYLEREETTRRAHVCVLKPRPDFKTSLDVIRWLKLYIRGKGACDEPADNDDLRARDVLQLIKQQDQLALRSVWRRGLEELCWDRRYPEADEMRRENRMFLVHALESAGVIPPERRKTPQEALADAETAGAALREKRLAHNAKMREYMRKRRARTAEDVAREQVEKMERARRKLLEMEDGP